MKEALIVGGSNGIGLSIAMQLEGYDIIHIVDKVEPAIALPSHIKYKQFDLTMPDYSFFDQFGNISLVLASWHYLRNLAKTISSTLFMSIQSVQSV